MEIRLNFASGSQCTHSPLHITHNKLFCCSFSMSNFNSNQELSPWDIVTRHDNSGFHLGGGRVVHSCQNFALPWKFSCQFSFNVSIRLQCSYFPQQGVYQHKYIMWSFDRLHENAPEVVSESLKFSWGACPQTPLGIRYAQHTNSIHRPQSCLHLTFAPTLKIFLNEPLDMFSHLTWQ